MSSQTWLAAVGHFAAGKLASKRRDYRAEALEGRLVLSALPIATPPITVVPVSQINHPNVTNNLSAPYTPGNIQTAYGISSISFGGTAGNGAGQTIAIVDAYNDPNIISDTATFDTHFSLPQFNATGNPTLTVLNQTGGTTLPANATTSNGGWDSEISLDVEWAHSVAPKANIILFEANSSGGSDLYAAVQTAAAYAGVSVISMSWGSSEFMFESSYDSDFTTPGGHQGVTFVASTGDSNAPSEYPAYSPNVLAVGGTTLSLGTGGSYTSETAWGNVSSGSGGGGGISADESQPSYQTGNVNGLSTTKRTVPDVSMLADPSTGVYMYDSWAGGADNGGYYIAGGTSLAAPMWAGLVAIADEGRALSGLGTLDGRSQTLPTLYSLPSSDFHDITSGNNGYAAGTGYDLASGIGSPIANLLVPALAGVVASSPSKLAFTLSPSSTTAGSSLSTITVDVEDASGNIVTTDSSSVTLSFGNNAGNGTLSGTLTATAVNGVATFTGLSINKAAGGYTLHAADGSLTAATSGSFTITPGAAAQLIINQQPVSGTVNVALGSPVIVGMEDAYGNVVTSNNTAITLTLNNGGQFFSGNNYVTVNASNGVATFSALQIYTAGTFTLTAGDGSMTTVTTSSFTIAKSTPVVQVVDVGGTYDAQPIPVSGAYVYDPSTSGYVDSFGDSLLTYNYYAGMLAANQISGATPLSGAPSAAGTYTVVATYAGSANYNSNISSPEYFLISQRTLHVLTTAQGKIYNGTNTATVTLSSDAINGDVLTLSNGSATFASKDVSGSITVTVSGISISGPAAANYSLAGTTATTTAAITPLAISGSITAANKTYNGNTSATITSATLTGVITGDSVALVSGAVSFNSKDVTAANTVTDSGMLLTGAQAGDYTLSNTTESAGATISPLSVSGSVSVFSKTYDGSSAASIAGESVSGVLGNDSVSMTGGVANFTDQDAGSHLNVNVTGLSLTGAQASDYALTNPSETATASIQPMGITASITAADKTYDHTTAVTLTSETLTGVQDGDDVTLTGGSATFAGKDAGQNILVTAGGFTLSGAQAGDYTLVNPNPTTTADITPMSLSAGFVAANKVYDGTIAGAIASSSLVGVFNGDSVGLSAASVVFASKDVANGISVTAGGLSLIGPQAADYSLTNTTASSSANITPKTITAGITASNKVYDGTTTATVSGNSLNGVITGDDVSLLISGAANFNSANVSSANTVTLTGLSLTGDQAGDYTLAGATAQTTAHITPLSVNGGITIANKTYDGTTAASISGSTVTGVLNGDNVSITGSASFFTKDVGGSKLVIANGLTLTGPKADDYSLANPNETALADITPKTVTGSITASSKVYDGTTSAALTSATLSGVVSGDSVSLAGGGATFNTADVSTANTVTISNLSLAGAQAGDYVLANPTETAGASITPLPIDGSVTAFSKYFDGTTAATINTRSLNGVLGSDDVSLVGGSATFNSSTVGNGKTVTATGLSLAGADAGNYSLADPTETTTANIQPLSISGTVVNDTTVNGISPNVETGLGGRTVTLQIAGKGTKGQKTTKTDASGNFSFPNLSLGNYVVKVTAPTHWKNTTSAANGDSITLAAGQTPPTLNFAQSDGATISGSVFLDANNDGKRQAKERGLSAWTVTLTAAGSSQPTYTTTTDASGNYAFSNVPIGNYKLATVESSGYSAGTKGKSSYSLVLSAGKTVSGENFAQQLIANMKHVVGKRRAA